MPALREVDLVIRDGEYLAITGPSGSGKSTLLNLLGLLDRPTTGQYELNGTDMSSVSERDRTAIRGRHIGFVFQSFHLLPYRSTVENVMLAMLYAGAARRQRHRLALETLDRVGLAHRAHAPPRSLSGGEQQRVAIARALVNRPSLLLCDEPTGNLDSATAGAVLDLIDGLHHDGLTVVVITHDLGVATRAGRQVTVRDGVLEPVR